MIKINDEWFIDSDSSCYMLKRYYTQDEKELRLKTTKDKTKTIEDYDDYFETFGYYSTMESAIDGYIKHLMRLKVAKGKITTFTQFITELRKIKKEISNLISPIKEDASKK